MLNMEFYFKTAFADPKVFDLFNLSFGKKNFKGINTALSYFENRIKEDNYFLHHQNKVQIEENLSILIDSLKEQRVNISKVLDEEIYPRFDLYSSLSDLEPKKSKESIILFCPKCKKKEAYVGGKGSGHIIICNRNNNCGEKTSFIEHIQNRDNLSFYRAVKSMADDAGVNLEAIQRNSEVHRDGNKKKCIYKKAADPKVLERTQGADEPIVYREFDYNKKFLVVDGVDKYVEKYDSMSDAQKLKLVYTKWLEIVHTYEQTPKKVYFKGRAIDPNVVRCIDYIGYLPVEKIDEALEKLSNIFSKDELIKFSFLKEDGKRKWNYAKDGGLLFIPSYDEYSNLVTAFRVRMTKPTEDTKKWKEVELSANHILQALPFGMGYKLIRDAKKVNMFEGPPDALASRMVTQTPFIGIAGTNRVKDEYLSYLIGKTVYLYFDQDPAGLEGVQKLAQKLLLAGAFPVIMKWNPLLGADINEALINGNLEKIVRT